jgi:two-component system chemotaxis response regulator CheY
MMDIKQILSADQLERLSALAWEKDTEEEQLVREAMDDLLLKYDARKKMLHGKTVMLVDDSTLMRTMLRDMVQKHGYRVLGEAENGKLGAQYYQNFLVDFVLLGIQMPVMDGMEFLKQITKHKDSRVIVVTAACQVKNILEAIEFGADYFIIKPFTAEQMIDVLSMHESEFFKADKLHKYSQFFYRIQGYDEGTKLTQKEIDALRECE